MPANIYFFFASHTDDTPAPPHPPPSLLLFPLFTLSPFVYHPPTLRSFSCFYFLVFLLSLLLPLSTLEQVFCKIYVKGLAWKLHKTAVEAGVCGHEK